MHKKLRLPETRPHLAQGKTDRKNGREFRKVAVFDDMPAIVSLYADMLSRPEIRVVTEDAVHTAEEALSIFRTEQPDLVITDLSLTRNGTEGFDILKGIRMFSPTIHVPIALFTSAYVQGGTDGLSLEIRDKGYDALFNKTQTHEVVAFVEMAFDLSSES